MAPSSPSQSMLAWVLEQLRHFLMFNSRLVHQKVMMKSNAAKTKTEQFVFLEPISRSQQVQFEVFLEALNLYFAEKLERNNVLIEVNCAFQKSDIFEPIELEYKVADNAGRVQKLPSPYTIAHKEGDIISVVFVDAKVEEDNQTYIGKE